VHNQKVVRLTFDLPFSAIAGQTLDDEHMLEYLDQRVGRWVGIQINVLEADEQEVLEAVGER
jgi:hypothetical protein